MSEMRIEAALALITRYGGIDGAHHKQWLLDQVVRALTEDEFAYSDWVKNFEDGIRGAKTYHWDVGITP